jgi:thioesterase domain-containing protein
MAAYYAAAIRRQQASGPYCLGGYCYGGVVAYEVARLLQAQGEQVALLAIFEGYAPRGTVNRSPLWPPLALLRSLGNLPFWMRDMLQRPGGFRRLSGQFLSKDNGYQPTKDRDWEQKAAQMAAQYTAGDLTDLDRRHRKLLGIHLRAIHEYEPQTYPGRVTLYRVQAMLLRRAYDPEYGWGRLAEGGVEIKKISGAHYNILERPYVESLADALGASLNRVNAHLKAGSWT